MDSPKSSTSSVSEKPEGSPAYCDLKTDGSDLKVRIQKGNRLDSICRALELKSCSGRLGQAETRANNGTVPLKFATKPTRHMMDKLDATLNEWIGLQKKENLTPLVIRGQAVAIYKELFGESAPLFVASKTWYQRFKNRSKFENNCNDALSCFANSETDSSVSCAVNGEIDMLEIGNVTSSDEEELPIGGAHRKSLHDVSEPNAKMKNSVGAVKDPYILKREKPTRDMMDTLDQKLTAWIELQQKETLTPVIVRNKAVKMYKELYGETAPFFVASKTWFQRFKIRCNVEFIGNTGTAPECLTSFQAADSDASSEANRPGRGLKKELIVTSEEDVGETGNPKLCCDVMTRRGKSNCVDGRSLLKKDKSRHNVMLTLDKKLNEWIQKQKKMGAHLGQTIIRKKAIEMYNELYGDTAPLFMASKSWYWRFKNRCKVNGALTSSSASSENSDASSVKNLKDVAVSEKDALKLSNNGEKSGTVVNAKSRSGPLRVNAKSKISSGSVASKKEKSRRDMMESLDKSLIEWIKLRKKEKGYLSASIIRSKAVAMYKRMNGRSARPFLASKTWYRRFKRRFNVRCNGNVGFSGSVTNSDVESETSSATDDECLPSKKRGVSDSESEDGEASPDEMAEERDKLRKLWESINSGGSGGRVLTNERMSRAFLLIREGVDIFLDSDPNLQRSSVVAKDVEKSLLCYKNLYAENVRKA